MQKNIGTIKARLLALGVTQDKFAVSLGYSATSLSHWINEKYPMPEGMLDRINAKLDVLEEADRAALVVRDRILSAVQVADQAHDKALAQAMAPPGKVGK